ncbi:g11219 [Coccomyxa viridis]|uniref:G11219 protein n=1 Tax=Coccomyxa viridis TaxID=1274662 RepID=A0ABP1G7D4_9CHLO
MHKFPERDVIIVGGGYGALSAALALHRVGVSSLVLERASSARQEGFSIGAFSNAWRALEELGVADDVRKGHLSQERVNFADSHEVVYRTFKIKELPPPEGLKENELRVIRRIAVPTAMSKALPKDTIQYGCEIASASVTPTGAEVELAGGQKLTAKMVILADGVHSKTAAKYHKMPLNILKIGGWRGMADLDCEKQETATATFSNGANARTGTIPVIYDAERKKMTWYYFMAASMTPAEMKSYKTIDEHKAGMHKHMKGWNSPHLKRLIAATEPDALLLSHIYQRQVQPGQPWFEGCLTGVGDCAHATRPDLGQGGAMAIEDGVELGIFIGEAMESAGKPFHELTPTQIGAALRDYEMLRSHRVCHIISKSGFIGNLFLFMGFLPRWLSRFFLGWFLDPIGFLEHTRWAPHGSLRPLNLKKAANGSSTAEE